MGGTDGFLSLFMPAPGAEPHWISPTGQAGRPECNAGRCHLSPSHRHRSSLKLGPGPCSSDQLSVAGGSFNRDVKRNWPVTQFSHILHHIDGTSTACFRFTVSLPSAGLSTYPCSRLIGRRTRSSAFPDLPSSVAV